MLRTFPGAHPVVEGISKSAAALAVAPTRRARHGLGLRGIVADQVDRPQLRRRARRARGLRAPARRDPVCRRNRVLAQPGHHGAVLRRVLDGLSGPPGAPSQPERSEPGHHAETNQYEDPPDDPHAHYAQESVHTGVEGLAQRTRPFLEVDPHEQASPVVAKRRYRPTHQQEQPHEKHDHAPEPQRPRHLHRKDDEDARGDEGQRNHKGQPPKGVVQPRTHAPAHHATLFAGREHEQQEGGDAEQHQGHELARTLRAGVPGRTFAAR